MGDVDLKKATRDELMVELRDRFGLCVVAFGANDALDAMVGDSSLPVLSEAETWELASSVLSAASDELDEELRRKAHSQLCAKWVDLRADLLAERGVGSPKP